MTPTLKSHSVRIVASRTGALGVCVLMAATLTLAGCGDSTKRALGLTKSAPDEFAVVSRAPLSQPPDYGLRPPRPGAPSPVRVTPTKEAEAVLFKDDTATRPTDPTRASRPAGSPQAAPRTPVSQITPGESALLSKAGASEVDPNIRTEINRESAVLAEADRNFIQRLLDYNAYQEEVVNAPAEARRLRENEALGKPPNAGQTPTIERKQRGLLEGIF